MFTFDIFIFNTTLSGNWAHRIWIYMYDHVFINESKTEMSQIEMSLKPKYHQNWNVAQNGNITKAEMSLTLKCH